MKTILRLKQLEFGPRKGIVLAGPISCLLKEGQLLWVQGPNGSGKTTLIKTLLGQAHVHRGTMETPPRKQIAYLPQMQNRSVPWPITLGDVLNLAEKRPGAYHSSLIKKNRLHLPWNTASGGERQRILLMRTLQQNPALLIVDEPLNHLDLKSQALFVVALRNYMDAGGAVIVVEHDAMPDALAPYLSQRIELAGDSHDD